jgi:hypothetical protein
MDSAIDVYAGYQISVTTRRNERGAYMADLKVSRDGQSIIDAWPETIQPEWRTPGEAIRDGIERAQRVIRQRFMDAEAHSWVAARGQAQSWFSGELQHQSGVTFTRG